MNTNELFKDVQDYLEGRIKFLENKASLLLAIQAGVSIFLFFIIKEIFINNDDEWLSNASKGFLIIYSILIALDIILILQTIKPATCFFKRKVDVDKIPNEKYMWPDENNIKKEKFIEIFDDFKDEDIRPHYKSRIFILYQLVHKKYKFFDWAILVMKINVLISIIGIIILLMRYIGW